MATDLDRQGIDHFLPLVCVRRKSHGRITESQLPLFPCYLFLNGGDEARYATLMTHRAANVLEVADQQRLNHELRHIWQIIASKQPVDLFPAIRQGRQCRVTSGPLAGIEGVVLRRRGMCRVCVGVEALGQSAELEIDPRLLEVIE